MRVAYSIASAPPLVKNTFVPSPVRARSTIRWAARLRWSLAWTGAIVHSRPACSWMAATTFGCWWPMFVLTIWDEKSRYRRPASSQTYDPAAPAITIGWSADWADHE